MLRQETPDYHHGKDQACSLVSANGAAIPSWIGKRDHLMASQQQVANLPPASCHSDRAPGTGGRLELRGMGDMGMGTYGYGYGYGYGNHNHHYGIQIAICHTQRPVSGQNSHTLPHSHIPTHSHAPFHVLIRPFGARSNPRSFDGPRTATRIWLQKRQRLWTGPTKAFHAHA